MIKRFLLLSLYVFFCINLFGQSKAIYNIVPRPSSMQVEGSNLYKFDCNTSICVDRDDEKVFGKLIADLFKSKEGCSPKVFLSNNGNKKGGINIKYTKSFEDDAYCMNLSDDGLCIESSTKEGFFYAFETLRQIINQSQCYTNMKGSVYLVSHFKIEDNPRFKYRGMMLDVARFFMPKEQLLKLIDAMALVKLNKLHIHLTDDNGWRIEIKKYPKLASIGGYRVDRENEFFSHRRNQKDYEKATIGGYYTQNDLREIVKYAKDRMIDIIPEVDVPAHSNAALTAYPEYACSSVDKKITVLPGIGEDHYPIIFCAGQEKTYTFLQDILDEVMSIFPYEYIHIGGDEADKTYWKKCPDCQRCIKNNNLTNEEDLQGYFMNRISRYVNSKGRKVMGWDEVTNFDIPEGMTVFGWRGDGNAALKAAKLGHNFILTPGKKLYLIRYQGPQWFEPMTYFGNNTLRDIYEYEPIKDSWPKEYSSLLLGVQASMWTEFCRNSKDVFYMVFPRLVALSEVAWSKKDNKDYSYFLKSLDAFLPNLSRLGINYAEKSMYNIQHRVVPIDGKLSVYLSCDRPDVDIRYTTDGTIPTYNSPIYKDSLKVSKDMLLMAASFRGNDRLSDVLNLPIEFNMSTGYSVVCNGRNISELTNGVRGSIRQSDFEWYAIPSDGQSSIILTLKNDMYVQEVILGILNNYSMMAHRPHTILVETSIDGSEYTMVAQKVYEEKTNFIDGNFVFQEKFSFPKRKLRYIKITSIPWDNLPLGHVRIGRTPMAYYDEIILK